MPLSNKVIHIRAHQGFTLIELLTVITIIGMLATIVISSLKTSEENAKVSRTVAEIRQVQNAIAIYMVDVGGAPVANCSNNTCTAANDPMLHSLGAPGWAGPYSPTFYDLAHAWGWTD